MNVFQRMARLAAVASALVLGGVFVAYQSSRHSGPLGIAGETGRLTVPVKAQKGEEQPDGSPNLVDSAAKKEVRQVIFSGSKSYSGGTTIIQGAREKFAPKPSATGNQSDSPKVKVREAVKPPEHTFMGSTKIGGLIIKPEDVEKIQGESSTSPVP